MSHVTSRCLEQFGWFASGLNQYETLSLKEAYHNKSFKVFGSYEKIWRDSPLMQKVTCEYLGMENIIMDKSSMMKGVDDNDDDDHEYYYCHYYYHHHHHHHHHPHPHQNHYLHISSIAYLYIVLTLHLNQNHLGTSGDILVSLRKDHLSD